MITRTANSNKQAIKLTSYMSVIRFYSLVSFLHIAEI